MKKWLYCLILILVATGCTTKQKIKSVINRDELMTYTQENTEAHRLKDATEELQIVKSDDKHMLIKDGNSYLYIDLNDSESKVYKFKEKNLITVKIVEIIDEGYVVNHSGHFDVIEEALANGKKVGDYIEIVDPHTIGKHKHYHKKGTNTAVSNEYRTQGKSDFKNQTKNKKKKKKEKVDGFIKEDKNQTKVLAGKNENLNMIENDDNYIFDLKDVIRETENGYIVRHGDHLHFIYKNNKSSEKKKNNQSTKNEQSISQREKYKKEISYIAELNGVDEKDIRIEDNVLIYPHLNHEHAIELDKIIVPEHSDDPEKDFEMELENLAKQFNMDVNEILIEDGYMIIQHGDHSHRYQIKSTGWKEFIKNRIPEIYVEAESGALNREVVYQEVERLLKAAKEKFSENNSKKLRRIERVLTSFKNGILWGTSSTKAHLDALATFNEKYIQSISVDEKPSEPNSSDFKLLSYSELSSYVAALKEKVSFFDPDSAEKTKILNDLETNISYRAKSVEELSADIAKYREKYHIEEIEIKLKPDSQKEKFIALRQRVANLDQDKYGRQRAMLLSAIDTLTESEKTDEKYHEIEEQINTLTNTNAINQKFNEVLNYLTQNVNDRRLSIETKQLVQKAIAEANENNLKSLNDAKLAIKMDYQKAERDENKYSTKTTALIIKIEKHLELHFNGETSRKLNEIKEKLQKHDYSKKQLFEEATALFQSLENISENSPTEEVKEQPSSDSSSKGENQDSSETSSVNINEGDEIITFIEANKRNLSEKNIKVKLDFINHFNIISEQWNNGEKNISILHELQELKKQANILIQEKSEDSESSSGNFAFDTSDWG